jgi:toxin ParE1/3/4
MPRILRTERAEADLIEILVFLRSRNPKMADRFESDFEKKCQLLSEFPLMGRDRSDLSQRLRSSLVKPYVLLYRPIEDGIEIIRVIHGARDISSLFESS